MVFESHKEVDLDELDFILPFLDEDVVDKLLINAAEEGRYHKLPIIIPFASEAAITDISYRLMEKEEIKGKNIALIAPYVSDTDIDKISLMLYQKLGIK